MTDQSPTLKSLREAIHKGDLRLLFTEELGWDSPRTSQISEEIDGRVFTFTPVAQKINFVVYLAGPTQDGKLPNKNSIRKLERKLDAKAAERLVIYSTASREQALWVHHKKVQGKAAILYTVEYKRGLRNEALIHYLKSLYISLGEDLEGITTIDVARKARNIELEKITKKFYKEFDKVRTEFSKQISGVKEDDKDHYAGLMLNRLMFVYFIQKREYLDSDPDYLGKRLKKIQSQRGNGDFQSFYRAFLLRLFHEGLGAATHNADLNALIGKVPYLNGGLFEKHRIEQENDTIEILDDAFEKVFAFFDGWRWTIDESIKAETSASDKPEINPDVLGYIFERYINEKEKGKTGAYYTKEDITDYITKNTILPYILERAREEWRVAFEGETTIWELLKNDPDRYIHAAVRKGSEYELPAYIQAGLDTDQPDLFDRRKAWNRKADEEYALPTEIWREVVARRTRYFEVRGKLERGEVQSVPDLVTLNLDIVAFAQDVIRYAESPELIAAFWNAITTITVLDPTCGSGAFLFAAAGILSPLYHLCLEQMTKMVKALPADDKKLADFLEVLAEQAQHDRQYYVLKQIIIRNLYGVDIMAEAVEIAKLRLFLKLMAYSQKDDRKPNLGLEPLPDIDFNIRVGNTLVGYATRIEAEKAVKDRLLSTSAVTWKQIDEKVGNVDRLETRFRDEQLKSGGQVTPTEKQELRQQLWDLESLLNGYLAADYGINADEKPSSFANWHASHQPFHWFIDFHNIMNRGGFDCVVGNPPYVEMKEIKGYNLLSYRTMECGNIYAPIMERCETLSSSRTFLGFIVPVSSTSTERYSALQNILNDKAHFVSNYNDRPSKLFDGLEHIRLSIHIYTNKNWSDSYTTRYYKWNSEERENLFDVLEYQSKESSVLPGSIPKIGKSIESNILSKMRSMGHFSNYTRKLSNHRIYYTRKLSNFLQILDFVPKIFDHNGNLRDPSELKTLFFDSEEISRSAMLVLNSTLFFWWNTINSDCRNFNKREIENFPINLNTFIDKVGKENIRQLEDILSRSLEKNSEMREMSFSGKTMTVQCTFPKLSKNEIDKSDKLLSNYYGFTAEELDYIVNYDIKYRMGADSEDVD